MNFRTVLMICEGQTEINFVNQVLSEYLIAAGLTVEPQTINTSPSQKGGALSYQRVKKHILNSLKSNRLCAVTTFFDLYALSSDFPGYCESEKKDLQTRLHILKQSLEDDIRQSAGDAPTRFLPYFQPYEFEALLLSDVTVLTGHYDKWKSSAHLLRGVVDKARSPEEVNGRASSKPSALFAKHLSNPNYRKTLHGTVIAKRIGLQVIKSRCKVFSQWLDELMTLA